MRSLESNVKRSKSIANYYNSVFGNMQENDLYQNGNHQTYVIMAEAKHLIMKELDNKDIKSYSSHRPVFYNDAFSSFAGASRYKASSEEYFNKVLHVPCRYDLTDNEVNLIADTIKEALLK
jgi:dTDP-4-amino-4,6-dideoxygalactose transaminase